LNLPQIADLDLTHNVVLDVANAGHALDIRIVEGSVQAGAWTYWFGDEGGWEDALPLIYGHAQCASAPWTFPLAEQVLERHARGEDVDTRPRAAVPPGIQALTSMGLSLVEVSNGAYVAYGGSDHCAYVYRDDPEDRYCIALVGIWYLDRDGRPVDNHVNGSEPWTQEPAVRELIRQEGAGQGEG
jgi:hypothetical protein